MRTRQRISKGREIARESRRKEGIHPPLFIVSVRYVKSFAEETGGRRARVGEGGLCGGCGFVGAGPGNGDYF